MNRFAVQGAFIIKSAREVLSDQYVIIEDNRVAEITPDRPQQLEILGSRHDIVMPGLINTHTHAAMTLFRGLADDLPLMTWLNDHIFPAEARFVDAEFVYLGSLLAAWEMTRSGTTAFCDGYFFEDQVGRAAKEVGIRAWLGEGVLQFPTPSNRAPERAIEHSEEFISRWLNDGLVKPTVFPHAVYTCTPELLRGAGELAEKYDILLQIHLSETATEVTQIKAARRMSPVAYLDSLGCLSARTLAAHCVVMDEGDIELLARRGVSVSHNAESNMKLASGVAPIPAMLDAGINVTIGTDGCASNNDLDMLGELATVAKLHKVSSMDPTVVDACLALTMATENGARALGLDAGRIEPGKLADIVVLDGNAPNLVPVHHPVSHIVYAASGPNAKHVIIDGKVVVRDFKSQTIDEDALITECRRIQARIMEG